MNQLINRVYLEWLIHRLKCHVEIASIHTQIIIIFIFIIIILDFVQKSTFHIYLQIWYF